MDNYRLKIQPFITANKINNPLLKVYFVGTMFEVKELARVLHPDEHLVFLTACKFNNAERILVAITNKRLIMINKGVILNRAQHSIFLTHISSAVRVRKIYFGEVVVYLEGGEPPFTLTGFWGSDTEKFVEAIEKAKYSGLSFPNSLGYASNPHMSPQPTYGYPQPAQPNHVALAELEQSYRLGLISEATYRSMLDKLR